MTNHVTELRCTNLSCDHRASEGDSEYACPKCGGIRDVFYDWDAIRRRFGAESLKQDPSRTLLRYLPLLPIDQTEPQVSPLEIGCTPVGEAPRLAELVGVRRLWVKDDGRLATASLKDRASFVGTARAVAQGRNIVAAASTGNAATSLAGLAASMGLDAHIFIPADAPDGKVAQLLIFGAKLFLIDADYDRTYDLCQEAIAKFGWYNRSAAVNPYLVEGKKTCGHEIGEALADSFPDWVAMSVGDGCSIAAAWKGLQEMKELGVIDRLPKMLGVQAEGAAPIAEAFDRGSEEIVPVEAKTLADSIRVGTPRNPVKAIRAVRTSGGAYVRVSDEAILDWLPKLGRTTGVFAEPTAVAALAGIEEARQRGIVKPGETVVHVASGNGLKDVQGALRSVRRPAALAPNLDAVETRLA